MEKGKGRWLGVGRGGGVLGEAALLGRDGSLLVAELAERLARAIEGGDEKGAAQAAAVLAQHHVALNVQLQEACFPPGPIR